MWAAYETIEKIELAANNGDTLGEAVISVKRNEFRSGQQRKIQLKNNNQKIVQTSSLTIFSSDVSKDANQKQSLRSEVIIFMIKSSILLAWPLLPAGVHSLDMVSI